MRHAWVALATAVTLTACGGSQSEGSYATAPPPSPMMAMEETASMDQGMSKSQMSNGVESDVTATEQYIAYTYGMGLRLPVASIEGVMQNHIDACNTAGTSHCIITNSSLNKQSEDYVSANVYLRATPDWIKNFMSGVEAEAEAAKGDVSYRNTSAEDLTRQIIDTGAQLTAQETLKTRLEDLLANREGELADLLATERELARVNATIDSVRSNLKAMRLRVSMSQLSVNYETKRNPVSAGALSPLADAFGGFFYNLSAAIAAVVTAFAIGLPWLILIGLLLFIWLRLIWPRIRRKKS